jgi:hypothetical protein
LNYGTTSATANKNIKDSDEEKRQGMIILDDEREKKNQLAGQKEGSINTHCVLSRRKHLRNGKIFVIFEMF